MLTGSSVAVTNAVLDAARAQGPALAAQQRQYAAADRSIRPQPFRLVPVGAR